jgi:hypothetical protein
MALSPTPLPPRDLPDLMARSFYAMRYALLGIGLLLPPALWVWELIAYPHYALPNSISGYYHTAARNLLVGALVAIGLTLVVYNGFNRLENLALNVAGVAAVGVAFFPCKSDPGATDGSTTGSWAHGVFALIAFGCIGAVAVLFGSDTVRLLSDQRLRQRFRLVYRILGVAMIVLPLVVLFITRAVHDTHATFFVETAALYAFAGYWLTKTIEYRMTNAERDAVRGTLDLTPGFG